MEVTSDDIKCILKNENLEESTVESQSVTEIEDNSSTEQSTVRAISTGQESVSEPKPEPEVIKKLQNSTEGYDPEDGAVNFIFVIPMTIALAV